MKNVCLTTRNLLSVTLKSCVSPTYLEVDFTNLYPFPLETKEAGTDNRNIVDDGKSQKLTHDDIKALKDKGIKGQVKIRFWCHFCATFDGYILVSEKRIFFLSVHRFQCFFFVLLVKSRVLVLQKCSGCFQRKLYVNFTATLSVESKV